MTTQQIENLLVSEFLKNKYNGLADNDYINEIADMLEHSKELKRLAALIGDESAAKMAVFYYFKVQYHPHKKDWFHFLTQGEYILKELTKLNLEQVKSISYIYNKQFLNL